MPTSVVLFTSDLRVHDHPPLRAALAGADEVVPLFVLDEGVRRAGYAVPNRRAFLADALASLDAGLRGRGGRLVLREGEVVREVRRLASETDAAHVHVGAGVSHYAHAREHALREALEADGRTLHVHDATITALPPGAVLPQGKDHFAVFTPYFRKWAAHRLREALPAPRKVTVPSGVRSVDLPERSAVEDVSPDLAAGGEEEGRRRLERWLRSDVERYEDLHDDLAGDATSRLSPFLHFGCLSPVEAVHRAREKGGAGAEAFVRQLAWRDFHHQVLAARPRSSGHDYRDRGDSWGTDVDDPQVRAWREGRTGYPVIDAAMRQLAREGWMHNRGRLLAASFLVKILYVDWRIGARHFLDLLVDGDVANNQMNWQWCAGTGTDTRPNRVLNPLVQGKRFDPDGAYVRRYVPELAGVEGRSAREPWRLGREEFARTGYPERIVDLAEAQSHFRDARGLD